MTKDKALFSTEEAAAYLGLTVSAVKWHVHTVKDLHPERIAKTLVFTREELDRFKSTPRPGVGRPRRDKPA